MINIAHYIDHTLLKPNATIKQIKQLCQEAINHGFYSVCVNPCHVYQCLLALHNTNVKVCSVVGFPLGANDSEIKSAEAKVAIAKGANELDMVMNVGFLLSEEFDLIIEEIEVIAATAHSNDVLLKVIIEAGLLTDEQKVKACKLAAYAGADFVKTCTGFSGGQATVEDVRLMKAAVGQRVEVKASGGIKDYATALAMIEAGASRIGTSSGVKIAMEELETLASRFNGRLEAKE
ncbi:MAG: deoxyribose-phosphate aldolase [Patescibacteria group bacterium]